jgi:hypothetical protein
LPGGAAIANITGPITHANNNPTQSPLSFQASNAFIFFTSLFLGLTVSIQLSGASLASVGRVWWWNNNQLPSYKQRTKSFTGCLDLGELAQAADGAEHTREDVSQL